MTLVQECVYDPPHEHEFPDDWIFGGPGGADPRADPRWRSSTYEYLDATLHRVYLTQVPLCDDQALDEFTKVAALGDDFVPVYLSVRRPTGEVEVLPWEYNKSTDILRPI